MPVKHSAFIDEIKINDNIVPDSTDYIHYWKRTFGNDENKFKKILKDISGIPLANLSKLDQDEYNVQEIDALLSLTFSEFDSFQTYEYSPTIEEKLSKLTFMDFSKNLCVTHFLKFINH